MLTRHPWPSSFEPNALPDRTIAVVMHVRLQKVCQSVSVWAGWVYLALTVAWLGLMSGCSSMSTRAAMTDADLGDPQAVMSLEEHLAQAARAEGAGDKERARSLYRQASKAYPVAEDPWRKLAESYFNVGDYGNAIQAAQEVMQRNPKDPVAASVLAISGLRLSTQALNVLRDQADAQRARASSAGRPQTKSAIIVAARLEAETLARNLREVLGEPVLVPSEATSAGPGPAPSRARPRAASNSVGAPAASRASPPPVAGASPFDKLK